MKYVVNLCGNVECVNQVAIKFKTIFNISTYDTPDDVRFIGVIKHSKLKRLYPNDQKVRHIFISKANDKAKLSMYDLYVSFDEYDDYLRMALKIWEFMRYEFWNEKTYDDTD